MEVHYITSTSKYHTIHTLSPTITLILTIPNPKPNRNPKSYPNLKLFNK